MEQAWTFYRRSTDRQELSIDDQRRECRAFAAARGWTVVREFVPASGFASGLTIERDATFQEMVRSAEARTHDVKYLVVYDVSRFGRLATDEKIYWEQRFKKHGGIQLVYVHGDFKNDGSLSDTLLKVVKHAEAHEYSMKLSEVTLRGAKSHAALGHSPGGAAPYGYDRLEIDSAGQPVRVMNNANDWKSNKLHRVVWTPSATKAPTVRWMFECYAEGSGLNVLVHQLNERRLAAPRGRFWSKTTVRHVLRNRSYLGERHYNRRSYKAYRRGELATLANPQGEWVVKTGAHQPLIDVELFERVQRRLKTRAVQIGRTAHRPYLLTGLARCGGCGYRMIGQPHAGNGYRHLTYTCSGYLRIGTTVCRSVHLMADALEGVVADCIREHVASPAWAGQLRATLKEMVHEEYGGQAAQRAEEVEQQLTDVKREIANIVQAIQAVGRFSDALREALVDLETRRDALRATLREASERAAKAVDAGAVADELMAYYGGFEQRWRQELDVEERKELLRCYVHQVDVHHSSAKLSADVWLYRVPVPRTQKTLALSGVEPLITRVNCGGPILPLVKAGVSVEPFVVKRGVVLRSALH